MEAKHTPGPWKVEFNAPMAAIPGHLIKADNTAETPIALLWEGGGTKGGPTQIANARLIAAAPELLEALEHMVAVSNWATTIQSEEQYDAMIANAEAAIRKAKGE
jgi:hypothetical protein